MNQTFIDKVRQLSDKIKTWIMSDNPRVYSPWDTWRRNIHEDRLQQNRINKAYTADCIPVSISPEKCSGVFQGKNSRYTTTLCSCSCADFNKRELPCKHMYRLAIELELFGDKSNIQTGYYARNVPKDSKSERCIHIIELLEKYPDSLQISIKELLSYRLYDQGSSLVWKKPSTYRDPRAYIKDASNLLPAIEDGLLTAINRSKSAFRDHLEQTKKDNLPGFVHSMGYELPADCKLKRDMVPWIMENTIDCAPKLYPHAMEVHLSDELYSVSPSIYTYLYRKFDKEALEVTEYDDKQYAWVTRLELPDDFETGLLNLFGTNPLDKKNKNRP